MAFTQQIWPATGNPPLAVVRSNPKPEGVSGACGVVNKRSSGIDWLEVQLGSTRCRNAASLPAAVAAAVDGGTGSLPIRHRVDVDVTEAGDYVVVLADVQVVGDEETEEEFDDDNDDDDRMRVMTMVVLVAAAFGCDVSARRPTCV